MSKILVARTPRTDRSKAKEGADDCEAIVSVNLKLTDCNINNCFAQWNIRPNSR